MRRCCRPGKVMWFSYPENPNPARRRSQRARTRRRRGCGILRQARPSGSIRRCGSIPPTDVLKPANIWCAGQTFTADGRLVVFGGNLAFCSGSVDCKGLNKVYTFNPLERDLDRAARHAPRALVSDRGQDWLGRAHRDHLRARRNRRRVSTSRNPDVELFTPVARSERPRHRSTCSARSRRSGRVRRRRPLPAHVRHAVGTHDGGGALSRGHLVPESARRLDLVRLDYPEHGRRPGLGHRGADARRHRRLDPRSCSSAAPATTSTPSVATTEIFDEASPGPGWQSQRRIRCRSGAATTTPCCCPTARWSPSAAASARGTRADQWAG